MPALAMPRVSATKIISGTDTFTSRISHLQRIWTVQREKRCFGQREDEWRSHECAYARVAGTIDPVE